MSTRNGPYARADDHRAPASGRDAMRYSRAEYAQVLALQDEVARADADYQRLRNAYMEIAQSDPTHEVALAMIGADMDRARDFVLQRQHLGVFGAAVAHGVPPRARGPVVVGGFGARVGAVPRAHADHPRNYRTPAL